MVQHDIHPHRVKVLNNKEINQSGKYVLYWMQQSQREEWNQALELAIWKSNELEKPVIVCFGIMDDYPDANLRHYWFMLEGLKDVAERLRLRKIRFILRKGHPAEVAIDIGKDAALIVCDRGYLLHQKLWRKKVANDAICKVVQVESDLIVPIEIASNKQEHAARTIRPKLNKIWKNYLDAPTRNKLEKDSFSIKIESEDFDDLKTFVKNFKIDKSVDPSLFFHGGNSSAKEVFDNFLERKLKNYTSNRNQPQTDDVSHMSMYLHFGHISPCYLANEARHKVYIKSQNVADFIEEMMVRRELAANFVFYNKNYYQFDCIPGWAKDTLKKHGADTRKYVYTLKQLENAETHDPYWNASMEEMKFTGFMHNYMRMYWGKQFIAWSKTPEEAFDNLSYLNNKYFIDGRDFNSYANVAWIFGLHDRGFQERDVFGTVRTMVSSGLKRKFSPDAYIGKVRKLKKELSRLNI